MPRARKNPTMKKAKGASARGQKGFMGHTGKQRKPAPVTRTNGSYKGGY